MTKYGNKRTEADGYQFDSLAECQRYHELRLCQQAGQITDLAVHPRFVLQAAFTRYDGRQVRAITYIGDFSYCERGRRVVEDTKGFSTQAFRLKQKLFWKVYPEIELRVVEV